MMHCDTEQAYGNYTLDVYQSRESGEWFCDWWKSGTDKGRGTTSGRRRREVVAEAKRRIRQQEGRVA